MEKEGAVGKRDSLGAGMVVTELAGAKEAAGTVTLDESVGYPRGDKAVGAKVLGKACRSLRGASAIGFGKLGLVLSGMAHRGLSCREVP